MTKNGLNETLRSFIPSLPYLDLPTVPYMWNLNFIGVESDVASFIGWALPFDGKRHNVSILVGGQPVGPIAFSDSAEYPRLYPWWPNAVGSTFSFSLPLETLVSRAAGGILAIDPVPAAASSPVDIRYRLYFDLDDFKTSVPNVEVQARIGLPSNFSFSLLGCTLAQQFLRVYNRFTGASFEHARDILEWGCGSGRVARHMQKIKAPTQQLRGVDIDKEAVAWANANLGPYFSACDLDPPLPFGPAMFDLVYAYSVFTHLERQNLKRWAEEIARILRPNGVFLFTILSDTAMVALAPNSGDEFYAAYAKTGIYDSVPNSQLETIGVTGDYYRNVWLKPSTLKELIHESFEIVAIETNFHFYQDLVVARVRPRLATRCKMG
jgi:SAM-dependent methyltransferase